jgi:hypothetical protein
MLKKKAFGHEKQPNAEMAYSEHVGANRQPRHASARKKPEMTRINRAVKRLSTKQPKGFLGYRKVHGLGQTQYF